MNQTQTYTFQNLLETINREVGKKIDKLKPSPTLTSSVLSSQASTCPKVRPKQVRSALGYKTVKFDKFTGQNLQTAKDFQAFLTQLNPAYFENRDIISLRERFESG